MRSQRNHWKAEHDRQALIASSAFEAQREADATASRLRREFDALAGDCDTYTEWLADYREIATATRSAAEETERSLTPIASGIGIGLWLDDGAQSMIDAGNAMADLTDTIDGVLAAWPACRYANAP